MYIHIAVGVGFGVHIYAHAIDNTTQYINAYTHRALNAAVIPLPARVFVDDDDDDL